jgi:hypothetical protein
MKTAKSITPNLTAIKERLSCNESFNFYLEEYALTIEECTIIYIDEDWQYTIVEGSDLITIRIDEEGKPLSVWYSLVGDDEIRERRIARLAKVS